MFVRIGDHIINLAQVAYIDFDGRDLDGNKLVEITFVACSAEYCMGLRFRKHEYEAAAALLRQVTQPLILAETDLPEKPQADPLPTVAEIGEPSDY